MRSIDKHLVNIIVKRAAQDCLAKKQRVKEQLGARILEQDQYGRFLIQVRATYSFSGLPATDDFLVVIRSVKSPYDYYAGPYPVIGMNALNGNVDENIKTIKQWNDWGKHLPQRLN